MLPVSCDWECGSVVQHLPGQGLGFHSETLENYGGDEMAQPVTCLLCQDEEPSQTPPHPHQKLGMVLMRACISSVGKAKIGRPMEFAGQLV